jgi:glycosyltransferase involved in cell wall biosynthesis
MGTAMNAPRGGKRFVLYVPNSELSIFHARSPWVMFPRSFHELGYDATLICGKFTGARPPGVRVVETSLGVRNPRRGGRIRSLVEPVFAFREIVRQRPNLVIVGPIRSSLFSFLPLAWVRRRTASSEAGHRAAFVLKTDWSLDCTGLRRWEAVLSKALLIASTFVLDGVTFETSCGVERARTLPCIRSQKMARVPLGFPQGTIERATYESHPREAVILCVARIARMKGQDVLLRAFVRLADRYPAWSIRLVGPTDDPAFEHELREFASQNGLTERVVFRGFLDPPEVDSEFARASVFCLPSTHSENAGQVQYEATAFGLPVVTTDVACARDALEMGWFVARARDVVDLAEKLEGLMRDGSERARASHQAQSRQRSYLDLVRMYLSIAGDRAGPTAE